MAQQAFTEGRMAEAGTEAQATGGDAGLDALTKGLGQPKRGVPPRHRLRRATSQAVDTRGRPLVYFDLETTGLDSHSHITQIAAIKGQDEFSSYVLPRIPIGQKAQEITGITCQDQQMYHHDNPVPSLPITQALQQFIQFLEEDGPVVLLGHNSKRFDCPILLRALQACSLLQQFRDNVHCFVDTLPLFRQVNDDLTHHHLRALYDYYIGEEFDAHHAREDARALQKIVEKADISHDTFAQHSFTIAHFPKFQ